MRAGRLNRKIVIQHNTSSVSDTGSVSDIYTNFATVWASIEPKTGKELFNNDERGGENPIAIRIRYLSGITTKMRIINDGKIYDIKSIVDVQDKHVEMLLDCLEQHS